VGGVSAETATPPTLDADAVPVMPRGVRLRWCPIREDWFLLAPERAVKLDPVGAAILEALSPDRTFAGVVAHLAARFDAPEARIAADASAFLTQMLHRRMVEIR